MLFPSTEERKYISLTWLVLGLGLAIRLCLSGQFLLVPDEAYYWQWSRYLSLGYYDHPPMIAWGIWLATKLFGHTEFAVRLPTILALAFASVYLCLLAARWFSWRIAFQVALLTQGVLLLIGSALIATPDGMLLLCWSAACFHAARAVEEDTLPQWLLTGMWFGLGLLSKYTMLLFLPSLFLAMLCTAAYRTHLLTYKPWLGLLLGCLLFTPVILWNAENNWVTFRHILFQGGGNTSTLLTFSYLPDFLGTQAALLSPILFLFILAGWALGWSNKRIPGERISFLVWMSLTTFLVFTLLSLHVRIYGNWSAPAYLTAFILIAALYSPGQSGQSSSRYGLWNFGLGLSFCLSTLILILLLYPILPLKVSLKLPLLPGTTELDLGRLARETEGWDELGERVDKELLSMRRPEETFLFGLRYQFASELAFYMKTQPRTVTINRWSRPNVYDFWFTDAMLLGKDAVGIFEHEPVITVLPEIFARVDPVKEVKLHRTGPWFGKEVVQTLYLARCYGFKGGRAWVPKNSGDVRAVQ
ncbi:MAG: glycosyltransferase family 39 protein [Candidatus Electrothrix aestuarii]|uniref:Glycosyltransferase family 39 protein n=1 Tax=Candidatus Electrothrix aestuarii TaxID=3062594 RepID=A0AAU8M1H5_9BACT|nr:glycosyltransferase family 39 protein [Candidatus Electrothrix aestuarii]